jgi:hypothetical protein
MATSPAAIVFKHNGHLFLFIITLIRREVNDQDKEAFDLCFDYFNAVG